MIIDGHGPAAPPGILYGTAWKEDETERLVGTALAAGFRGVDTANQRKHYVEAGVGAALATAFANTTVKREQLFIQTKYTFARGQDHRLPYDADARIATQVAQSFARSQEHLGVRVIDSLLLHGPTLAEGLVDADHEAWRAMEDLHGQGLVRFIGISNVSAEQLQKLVTFARVAPAFVQNRCYAARGWDAEVRAICREHNVTYQGFSLLTANRHVVGSPTVATIAARHQLTAAQAVLRFSQQLGMLPLTGTKDAMHMADDLAISAVELSHQELALIEHG